MTERSELSRSELIGGVSAGVLLFSGSWLLLEGGPRNAAAAVILWTAALALSGLCLGRPVASLATGGDAAGPAAREAGSEAPEDGDELVVPARRRLALAERLGLGPLGGAVGGAAVTVAVLLLGGSGLAALLGVDLGADGGVPGLGRRLWTGAIWGLALGAFYRRMPGASAMSKGVIFSFIPATWALLIEYPLFRGQGVGGSELGSLTFLIVVFLHLVWGVAVGGVFQWAELTSENRLDRPLGAPSP